MHRWQNVAMAVPTSATHNFVLFRLLVGIGDYENEKADKGCDKDCYESYRYGNERTRKYLYTTPGGCVGRCVISVSH